MDNKQRKRTNAPKRATRKVSSDKTRVREPGQKKPEKQTAPDVVFMPPKPFNRNRFLLHLATVAAVVIALLLSLSVFFKVENIRVSGTEKYDIDTVMQASGISQGENLITLSRAKIASKIMKALPYVKSVRIGIKLPDTVVISIEEVEVTYAVRARDDSWWLISSDGKVVEAEPEGERTSHTKILGVQIEVPKVGDTATAMEQPPATDEAGNTLPVAVTAAKQLETALAVVQQMELSGIIGDAASVDVTSIMSIVVWYEQRIQVKIGNTDKLPVKISRMKDIVNQIGAYEKVSVDLTDPDNPAGITQKPF